jgi:hypothetical protein
LGPWALYARRGTLAATGKTNSTWFRWTRRYDERGKPWHSAKPLAFLDLVESMSPGPYLELFSRGDRSPAGLELLGHESLATATLGPEHA